MTGNGLYLPPIKWRWLGDGLWHSFIFVYPHYSYFHIFSHDIYASGWKTARVVVPLSWKWGLTGVGWANNVHVTCNLKWCYARATSWLGVWVGWGGPITFMLLAISSDATLGLRHGLGFGWGGVGWGNNVHATCNLKSIAKQTLGRLKRLVQKWKTTIISKLENLVNTMKSLQH